MDEILKVFHGSTGDKKLTRRHLTAVFHYLANECPNSASDEELSSVLGASDDVEVDCEAFIRDLFNVPGEKEQHLQITELKAEIKQLEFELAQAEITLQAKCDEIRELKEEVAVLREGIPDEAMAPEKPPGMVQEPSTSMKDRQWNKPETWVLTVRDWHAVLEHMKGLPRFRCIKKEKRFVNMHDATKEFVKPWSKGTGCGLSLLMTGEEEHSAEVMLSHSWGEDAEEMQDAVRFATCARNIQETTYLWFCCFANYQAEDGCGPSVQRQVEMQPFKQVVAAVKGQAGMLAVHTTRDDLYSRLWCVHEIDEALDIDVQVTAAFSQKYEKSATDRFCRFVDQGFSHNESLQAAGIGVNSIKAKCSRKQDEELIIPMVSAHGGFKVLDRAIEQFRIANLPDEIKVLNTLSNTSESAELQQTAKLCKKGDQRQTKYIMARLRDNDLDMRRAAVQALAEVCEKGDQTAIAGIVSRLEDNDRDVRFTALNAFAAVCEKGDQTVVAGIVSRLEHDNGGVRFTALKALAAVCEKGDQTAIAGITTCLEDNDEDVRQAAAKALAEEFEM